MLLGMSGDSGAPPAPARFRAVVPAVVGALAAVVALLAWGLSSPPGSSPDEHYHLASIWCGHGDVDGRCEPGIAPNVRKIPNPVGSQQCFTNKPRVSAACRGPAYGVDMPAESETWIGNWNGAYPPVFYRTMSFFVVGDLDPSVSLIRAANALVAVGLLGGLALLLPSRLRRVPILAVLATSVPLGLFLVASTNPSSWAYLGCATLWLAVHGAFEQEGWRRHGLRLWILLATVICAGARADAALFALLAIGLGLLLSLPRVRRDWLTDATCVLAVVIAVKLFRGAGQSSVVADGVPGWDPSQLSGGALLVANLVDLPRLWSGAAGVGGMGRLGWFDTPMPLVVGVSVLLALGGLLVLGWSQVTWPKAIAGTISLAAVAAYPLALLQLSHVEVGQVVQARYVLPLMVMFVGISLLPRVRLGRIAAWQAYVIAGALSVANAVALYTNLLRYTHGLPKRGLDRLHSLASPEWWWTFLPVGPIAVFLVGAVAFTVLAVTIVVPLSDRLTSVPEGSTIGT
jgi:hypothetical protein